MEHRRGRRKVVSLLITLDTRYRESLDGEIVDLSNGGACIRLQDFVPEPNTIVRLKFNGAMPEDEPLQCRALVVRRDGDSIGVMFDRRQDAIFLSSLIEANMPSIETAAPRRWRAGASATTPGIS